VQIEQATPADGPARRKADPCQGREDNRMGGTSFAARASRSSTAQAVLAPGAGSTAVGGTATRCVCRLYRSCKTERDHCYQQDCSKGLHRFSPINERVFVSRWRCRQREDGAGLLIIISIREGGGFRGGCLGRYGRSIEQILKGQKGERPRNEIRRMEQTLAYGRF